jgi:GNAT superfamily N-acetyltransferase
MAYPTENAEVCVVEDVMTVPEHRGKGIGASLTNSLVELGFRAGCQVAYLGNAPTPSSVYLKCDFVRINGAVMRRSAPGHDNCESEFYSPGQTISVRATNWGDLPGVACLLAQPVEELLIDYRRGLVSIQHGPPVRCVSNFTSIWYDCEAHGGLMLTMAGESKHRVLGFGSITPGPPPVRNHTAGVDVAVADSYADQVGELMEKLLTECRKRNLLLLEAFVAETDRRKASWFLDAGFLEQAAAVSQLQVGKERIPVKLLRYDVP